MATKGVKYEYKIVNLPNDSTEDEVTGILNASGAEGWWVISISHGAIHDDQIWGTVFMVRAV
jgi:Domain of unknown function (DUF4177)